MCVREFVVLLIVSLGVVAVAVEGYFSGDIDGGNAALGTLLMLPCVYVAVKGMFASNS